LFIFFSLLLSSLLTSPPLVVKFGNITQQPIRLIHESWIYTDGRNNAICVLADTRNEYAFNWGYAWASNNAGNLFADCSSVTSTAIDNCRVPNQPAITTTGSNNGLTGTSAGGGNPAGGNFIVVPAAKRREESPKVDESIRLLKEKL
jgi:hypothetical protein